MRYTHNYTQQNDELCAQGLAWDERAHTLTALFEREAAQHLAGLTKEDAGAVWLYLDKQGEEAAWFDYENFVGSIYAVTGKRSTEI
jgi:hypothetical protein